jgi:hypothetical protein
MNTMDEKTKELSLPKAVVVERFNPAQQPLAFVERAWTRT